MDLRKPFFDTILEMAKADKDKIVLVGDLGFSFKERFEKELPDQIINCGAAEQNMTGVAAGLARTGKKPYVYSGAVFITMRNYEFVRDDVAYNNTNVKLVGTGASGFLGFTHNLLGKENEEDLLKNLPNLQRFYPKNEGELKQALLVEGPAYIRL